MRRIELLLIPLLGLAFAALSVGCSPEKAAGELKIISYNILYGMRSDTTEGKSVFAEWVRAQDPDILAMQETNDFTQIRFEELARSYGHGFAVLGKEPGMPGSVEMRTKFPVSVSSKTPVVNVDKVLDNMWHGFIKCNVEGYNIIVLHLSPHKYWLRRGEIKTVLETVRQSGPFEKWIIMGDFNSVSPLDAAVYADGKYLQKKRDDAKKYLSHDNLDNDGLDYMVHQWILDFGFVDAARQSPGFAEDFSRRIDFIYVSPDLKDKVVSCGFIEDDFTAAYSDHLPVELVLKR